MKHVAVTLLQLPDGKFVFQRRTYDAPVNAGLLGFFGGHIEDGETSDEAVRREISEETSLNIDKLTFSHREDFVVDREGEPVKYYLYSVAISDLSFEVYEGECAEALGPREALKRNDLSSSVSYVLEKIVKEQDV